MSAQFYLGKLSGMASTVYTAQDAAYWYVPLTRAVPAAALACVITFAGGNYSPELGLLSFGGFALVSGLLTIVLNARVFDRGALRTVFLVQSVVSILAGIAALVGVKGGLPIFLVVVSAWAAIAGFLELYAGLRSRRVLAASRDWTFIGALTAVFALVALLIPPGYVQHYTGPDGDPRILNASVMMVGALAVYGVIVAVYLVIAALSLKWGPASETRNGTAQ
jgi:peptidoglycan biosynthesis protein MviN/MurJ (putative lipid II flippase)